MATKALREVLAGRCEFRSHTGEMAVVLLLSLGPVLLWRPGACGAGEAKPARTVEIATSLGDACSSGSVVIWKHDGKGGYDRVFEQEGLYGFPGVTIGDVDGDGIGDVVACSKGGSYLISHKKDGGFSSRKIDEYTGQTQAVAVGDVNANGRNEIVIVEGRTKAEPFNTRLHRYSLRDDGTFDKVTWFTPHIGVDDILIADLDGDHDQEMFFGSPYGMTILRERGNVMQVVEAMVEENLPGPMLNTVQRKYRDQCGYEGDLKPVLAEGLGNPKRLAFGDLMGGGSRCIAIPGSRGRLQILRHTTGKGYESVYVTPTWFYDTRDEHGDEWPASCDIGDALNDGRNVCVAGSNKFMIFGYDPTSGIFSRIWEGQRLTTEERSKARIWDLRIGDPDNDGRKEILYRTLGGLLSEEKDDRGYTRLWDSWAVKENKGRGDLDFQDSWESGRLKGTMRIATGDVDGR